VLKTEPVGFIQMKLIAIRDNKRSTLNRDVLRICRDKHSRQLLVWLVAYEEFSSQVWLTAYPNHSSNDSSQRASKPRSHFLFSSVEQGTKKEQTLSPSLTTS